MELVCMFCDRWAVGEVDVAVGLPAGFCRVHMEGWLSKHPELRSEPDVSTSGHQ